MADQRGAAMIEYSILITLVAGCLLFTVTAVAMWSQGKLDAFREAVGGPAAATTASAVPASGGDASPAPAAGDDASPASAADGGAGQPATGGSTVAATGNGNGNNGQGNGNGGANGSWSGGASKGKSPRCSPCGRGSR